MRTQAEILRDCETRFQEIRAEKERRDNDPLIQYPCESCMHFQGRYDHIFHSGRCTNPLVVGFGSPHSLRLGATDADFPKLCGPEKALWEPELKNQVLRRWAKRNEEWLIAVGIFFCAPALGILLGMLLAGGN